MNADHRPDITDLLKQLTPHDFLRVGLDEIAYIRLLDEPSGLLGYGIYAADGTRLSVSETFNTALAAVRHNDLVPVTLH